MSLAYRLMYRVGFVPWDTGEVPPELTALVDGENALPAGSALDIGCGTGTQAVYLASHGWQVSAIDVIEQPLRRARERAAAAGVDIEWIKADVTQLKDLGLAPARFTLVFDRGCYHGLNSRERAAYVTAVTQQAAPGATLLMMAFARNRVPVGPSGTDEPAIGRRFEGWRLESVQADSAPAPAGPLRNVPRNWYCLTRS
ncbi:MAG TPA: methyltransferase domain-containing protein [Solirubrobacteraceae bacterium]|nr:methyltransferase domain-containing protein [Solirubrobacteraceae bacterium]